MRPAPPSAPRWVKALAALGLLLLLLFFVMHLLGGGLGRGRHGPGSIPVQLSAQR